MYNETRHLHIIRNRKSTHIERKGLEHEALTIFAMQLATLQTNKDCENTPL